MGTERVDIDKARDQLADLVAFASEGNEVLIVQHGKPIARLIGVGEHAIYKSLPSTYAEFSSDEEPLAWAANGWEHLA
jgi:prevent-host-death family protein